MKTMLKNVPLFLLILLLTVGCLSLPTGDEEPTPWVLRYSFDDPNWRDYIWRQPGEATVTDVDGVQAAQRQQPKNESWGWVGAIINNPVEIFDENMVLRVTWRVDCETRTTCNRVQALVYYSGSVPRKINLDSQGGQFSTNEWHVSEIRLTNYEQFPVGAMVHRVDISEEHKKTDSFISLAAIEFAIVEPEEGEE